MGIVDHVVVDDTWLANHAKLGDGTKYGGQGWGAYLHPILPYSDALVEQFKAMHQREVVDGVVSGHEGYFDEAELIKACGFSKDTLVNGMAKELVGAEAWDMTKIVKRVSVDGVNPTISLIDRAAWLTGTAGINASGAEDYLTIASFEADLGTQTGHVIASVNSAITETATSFPSNDQGGFNQTYTSDNDALGDPTGGNLITISMSGQFIRFINTNGGEVIVDGLYTKATATVSYAYYTQNAIPNVTIKNCLIDGNSNEAQGIGISNATSPWLIYNNKIWGCTTSLIFTNAAHASTVVENNSLWVEGGSGRAVNANNQAVTFRNNVVMNDGSSTAFFSIGSATGRNNAEDDATGEDGDWSAGSGNVSNTTTGAIWTSTDDSASTFLAPVASSVIDGAAATPTLWSVDIAGNADNGTIGAQQIAAAGGVLGLVDFGLVDAGLTSGLAK